MANYDSVFGSEWEVVDPIQSITGSLNGAKPKFYKSGKTLVMTSFPHPNAVGTAISITLKPEYKFRESQAFMVVNYTAWTGSYQDANQYVLNSSTNTISASSAPAKNYYMLYAPVVFILE